jgi:hypothetical protein
LEKIFPKKDYSVLIPSSRQQKGFDLAVLESATGRAVTVQVKSSRSYRGTSGITPRSKRRTFTYTFWFNNFFERYSKGQSDFFILHGVYPMYDQKRRSSSRELWKSMMFLFTEEEMYDLLKTAVTNSGESDRFFAIGFDDVKEPYLERGFKVQKKMTEFLLHTRKDVLFDGFTN